MVESKSKKNNDAISYDPCLQDLFETQVEKSGEKDALILNGKRICYRELNERSNQLARKLRKNGVTANQIVGLMVENQSIEMLIGMIAIMKAGGAFLPIDANYPSYRIGHMISECNVPVVLTFRSLANKIPLDKEIICLDDESLYVGDSSNLKKENQAHDLVYVIYTSGSTGKPKGVQIEHRSIVNQMIGLKKMYDFEGPLHHLLMAPITFDPSVQQIFLPLSSGGELYLIPKLNGQNIWELWDLIISNNIDILNTVPSVMKLLIDHLPIGKRPKFKFLILAGEVFPKMLYMRIKEVLSAEKILNIYGPTEATINATLYECRDAETNDTIPIGKPLRNYNVMILDKEKSLAPIGIPGEMYISGIGLARGYINNLQLTEQKFEKNPYVAGERMYRTGDKGRWLQDGNIEFLGRIDNQVKINGSRVELGEVETILGGHPDVKEAVVVCQGGGATGSTRLIAYLVPRGDERPKIDCLRRFLLDKLPDFMLPSEYVFLDALPLSSHGKVDRHALLEKCPARADTERNYIAPRNEMEYQLTLIWKKVLGDRRIGVTQEFFKSGGTSLLAMILFGQIEKRFGKRIPLASIIEAPTIEKLAKLIAEEDSSKYWGVLVAIQPEGSKSPFFCIHGHRGNVIGFYELARHMGKERPFYGVQAEGLNGKDIGERRIPDMAVKYIEQIRFVQPKGPYFLGGWCMGGLLALEMAHLLEAEGERVGLLVMIDCCLPKSNELLEKSIFLKRAMCIVIDRLQFEICNLRSLERKGKRDYIIRKIINIVQMIQIKAEKIIAKYINHRHTWAYKINCLYEAHVRAILTYEPRTYKGSVLFLTASKQPLGIKGDPAAGWRRFFEAPLMIHKVAAHYLNIFNGPGVKLMAEKIRDEMNEVERKITAL